MTGFTNSKKEAVSFTDVVPFLVENTLKRNGGIYSRAADWQVHVLEDSNLITGQNPASSEKLTKSVFRFGVRAFSISIPH